MPADEYQAGARARLTEPAVQSMRNWLDQGKSVVIPRQTIQEAHAVLRALEHEIPAATPRGTLIRLEPVGGEQGDLARLVFASPDGQSYTVCTKRSNLGFRALYLPQNGFLGLLHGGVGNRGKSQQVVNSLAGEIRHELIHALRGQGLFTNDEWQVLVRHAQHLKILDWELRHYFRLVHAPNRASPGVTLRTVYEKTYAKEPNKAALMEEEAVAHAVEAYHHISQLPTGHRLKQALLPVYREAGPVLEKMFSGQIAARRPLTVLAVNKGRAGAAVLEDQRPVFAFAGVEARTANLASLAVAQRMTAAGKPAEAVYRATGWFKPPWEDKWYWEISDHGARLVNVQAHLLPNTEGRRLLSFGKQARRGPGWVKGDVRWGINIPLPQILHHPELFEAYPFLRQMRVNMFVGRDIPADMAGSGSLVYRLLADQSRCRGHFRGKAGAAARNPALHPTQRTVCPGLRGVAAELETVSGRSQECAGLRHQPGSRRWLVGCTLSADPANRAGGHYDPHQRASRCGGRARVRWPAPPSRDNNDAQAYLKLANYEALPGFTRDLKTYEVAMLEGKAITETDRQSLNEEAFGLVAAIASNVLEAGRRLELEQKQKTETAVHISGLSRSNKGRNG